MSLVRALRRLSATVGLIGIASASLSGCGGGSGSSQPPPGGSRSACTANTAQGGRARWTVLVYMNAANDLQPESLLNIAQMMTVGSDANVNIVVQWKQANCAGCGVPPWTGTRRYQIRPHSLAEVNQVCTSLSNSNSCPGDTSALDADRLPDPATNSNGTSDMGDWRTLRDFALWGIQNFPADHLALVVWDHGSGWQPTRSAKGRALFRAFSQDEQSGNEIDTEELPQALGSLPQALDMLIFDASLMQMVEVAYEARNLARVMVGSEESPPGAGYPYHTWLADLKADGANPCVVGTSIVNRFVANYPNNSNITQSVLDLSKMNTVASALNNFANVLRSHVNDQSAILATSREDVQRYTSGYTDYKDLYHYAELIRTRAATADMRQAASNVQNALKGSEGVILATQRGNFGQDNSNGLSVYIPSPFGYLPSYANLALSRVTNWDSFLQEQPN